MDWKDYQEEVASFFRELGLEASTDVKVNGARTAHDIDVLVKSHHVGFDGTWVVECKKWKNRVSKLHVLALRESVSDIGADRGILLSESGFKIGAIEAANLTNIQLTSLDSIRGTPIAVRVQPSISIDKLGLRAGQLIVETVDGNIIKKEESFSSDQDDALGKIINK